jgi:hypothetical protein
MTDDARSFQQAAVAELGRRALAGAGILELADWATRLLAQNLDVEHAGVLELSEDGGSLLVIARRWLARGHRRDASCRSGTRLASRLHASIPDSCHHARPSERDTVRAPSEAA